MLYFIPDTLLKLSLNTNKTGHLLVFNDTFNNVSGIKYNMVISFIGFNDTFNNVSGIT
jgi:hypothetical protein